MTARFKVAEVQAAPVAFDRERTLQKCTVLQPKPLDRALSPGAAVDSLARTARAHGVRLVVGVVERDGGTLYSSPRSIVRRSSVGS